MSERSFDTRYSMPASSGHRCLLLGEVHSALRRWREDESEANLAAYQVAVAMLRVADIVVKEGPISPAEATRRLNATVPTAEQLGALPQ